MKSKETRPMVYKQGDVDVYYYNYKEPFIEFEDGFGFEGALAYSVDKEQVQCHFCGQFYKAIRSSHLAVCEGVKAYEKKHNVLIEDTDDYKEIVGLNLSSILVGEATREKLIKNSMDDSRVKHRKGWHTLKATERRRQKLIRSNKRRKGEKITLEARNKRGTCPVQLLERIKEAQEKLGHTPSKREFYELYKGKYLGSIYQVYGSYVTAVEKAGFLPAKYEKERQYKYTDQELLDFLVKFYETHNRLSTASDHERGLLPTYEIYTKRFNGINNARRKAGLPTVYRINGWHFDYDYTDCDPKYLISKAE